MYDAVIVGASVAGCTAAIQLARQGRRVALLERNSGDDHHKKLCTHFIQASAIPVLESLGVVSAMEAAGAVRTDTRLCTPFGWIHEPETATNQRGINLPRYLLDPIMRQAAQAQSGVHWHPGANVGQLLTNSTGRVQGVVARVAGKQQVFETPLVIAADGRNSAIAKLANIPTKTDANNRFSYYTYYPGAILTAGGNANFWHLDSRLAFAYENGNGTSLLGIFLPLEQLAEFKHDPATSFRKFWDTVPSAPAIGSLQPLTELRGYIQYPNQRRKPAIPGLALIGDAAFSVDPMWACGISFAIASADRLATALGRNSRSRANMTEASIDRALSGYARSLQQATALHYWQIAGFSQRQTSNWLERFIFSAAVHDVAIARTIFSMIQRKASPLSLASPQNFGRAVLVHLKRILNSALRVSPTTSPTPSRTIDLAT